jgi:LysR family transcriptional regulator, low CO2-responsive transcriptional regulator
MRNLTLRQFRAVQAIIAHGKIVNAAKVLGLSAPAVTIQLRQVEEELGIELFDRTVDGMRPTAAGLAFVDTAQAIEERLRLLEDQIDAIKGVRAGSLTLGVVSTAKYFAPQLMAAFMKEHPDIEMRLKIGNRAETIANLKNHDVDIAVMGRPARDVPVRASAFGDHPLVIVAAPDHPLAKARDISKERIARENFLIREPGSGTRISLEIFLGEIPGRLDDLGLEMDSNETIKQAVMAGLGIAFISAHTVAFEVEARRLVILDVAGMPIRRQWFAVMRADRAISPAMATFHDFLMRKGAMYLPMFGRLYPAAPEPLVGA